jgi:hypothetical protein
MMSLRRRLLLQKVAWTVNMTSHGQALNTPMQHSDAVDCRHHFRCRSSTSDDSQTAFDLMERCRAGHLIAV